MAGDGSPGTVLLGPLRVVACNGTYVDPAVDEARFTKDVASQYIRTLDLSTLPLAEGRKPVLFTLARLPVSYLSVISAMATEDRRRVAALLGSLRSVGREGDQPLAEVLPPTPKPPEGSPWVGAVVDGCLVAPAELAQWVADEFGFETVQQLGQQALDFARLPKAARGPFCWWGGAGARR